MNATAKPPASEQLAIPVELAKQLGRLRRRLWTTKILEALCVIAMLILAAYLAVFALDRIWDTPSAGRRLALTILLGCAVALGLATAYRWVFRHRAWMAMGHFLQRWNRRNGDRVLAAIELTTGSGLAMESPQLRAAAIRQLSEQIASTDLNVAVDRASIRKRALALAAIAVPVLLSLMLTPHASLNAGKRLFLPWQSTERYTFVDLEILPEALIVPHGESFSVTAALTPNSRWTPNQGSMALQTTHQRTQAERQDRSYHFAFPGLIAPESARLRIGDCVRAVRIEPTIRPGLSNLIATITRPEYLQLPAVEASIQTSQYEVVAGSTLTLAGEISRELAEVEVRSLPQPLVTLQGAHFITSALKVQDGPIAMEIYWRDHLGLRGQAPYKLRLEPVEDAAPLVTLHAGAPSPIAMLEDDALLLSARAQDDFGVREIGYLWGDPDMVPEDAWSQHQRLQLGQPDTDQLGADVAFAPKQLGLSNKRWDVWAYALDYKPDRAPAFSEPRTIHVLNHTEHAEMIRAQFGQLQERLEDVARKESHLKQANEEALAADKLDPETLERQRSAELSNAKALETLTKNTDALLQDALKNQALDQSALAPWSEMMAAMKEVATQDMPAAADALAESASEASGGSPSQGGGTGKAALEKAIKKQQEAVDKLAKAMQQGQATEEKLEAATFINRLRQVGDGETSLAATMRPSMAETLGMAPLELDPSASASLSARSVEQAALSKETQYILVDLEHYHQRTNKEAYAAVHALMLEADVVAEMASLENRVQRNQHGWVIRSALHWSEQFHAWADALSPVEDTEAPSQDGEGGEGGMQGDLAMMLNLMRLVQREMTLRDQTRLLEQRKDAIADHSAQSSKLASEQWAVGRSVAGILATVFQPGIQQRLREAASAIDDAGKLLDQGNTGGETIAAQTEVIELLGQAAKSSGQGSGKTAGMEALAEMLEEMQIGNSPGGNPMGGASSLANTEASGAVDRDDVEDRRVSKASGLADGDLPAEFRDALSYFFEQREVLLKELETSPDAEQP